MCIYMNLSLLTGFYMRATLAFNGLKKDIIKGELWPHPDKIIKKWKWKQMKTKSEL